MPPGAARGHRAAARGHRLRHPDDEHHGRGKAIRAALNWCIWSDAQVDAIEMDGSRSSRPVVIDWVTG